MNTGIRNSHSGGLFQAVLLLVLLLVPLVSQAQVFFGSGGTSNTAPNLTNVALGWQALFNNTANGGANTAIGYQALFSNTTGDQNTATGFAALFSNTVGINNTANGWAALASNTTGYNNVANGYQALYHNTVGFVDTANGVLALFSNITGSANVASGYGALSANTRGSSNTADGYAALNTNTTGNNNTALGNGAGHNLTTGSDNIAIGNPSLAGESGVIRIGTPGIHSSTFIAGINGATAFVGATVFVNGNGQLGTLTSSRRFKNAIKDMGSVSDRLMQLRPVTFRYKQAAEMGTHPLQYGLIAEEVAKVYPDLVQYDKSGKPFTIYYHLLTPMLLNELQKAHHQILAQKTQITAIQAAHKAEIIALKADRHMEIDALKSELAALKQSQQQQRNALAKLSALMEGSQGGTRLQKAALINH